ncbi:uncharacterized protein K441DRAFT_727520 [Cenococcum geophilum 1.58]|uniref:uncharacterized protein n=1 Tax=Cenococcum geophilum 1.58 TaxID=794803 RepID=UPI00358EA1B0|nr:hypothetical protein K441DRAFT_727520 [Cenococcum geophilum 1.58]
MQSFTTIIAASAMLTAVSGSPIFSLSTRDVCGTAPSGSTNQAVLSQPSGVNNAEACRAKCEANTSCQSFVFGMVDNAIKCMLFSCAASAVPAQTSSNLLAYDKDCASVPTVTPTASNPTGSNNGGTGTNTNGGQNGNNGGNQPTGHKLAVRNSCGGVPTGQTNMEPISTPTNIGSAADCKTQCQANPSCKSFEFGVFTPGGGNTCRLYKVPASQVPAPSSGQTLQVFDVGCSF